MRLSKDRELFKIREENYELRIALANYRKGAKPISPEEQAEIRRLKRENKSNGEIAKMVRRSKSTVAKYIK